MRASFQCVEVQNALDVATWSGMQHTHTRTHSSTRYDAVAAVGGGGEGGAPPPLLYVLGI